MSNKVIFLQTVRLSVVKIKLCTGSWLLQIFRLFLLQSYSFPILSVSCSFSSSLALFLLLSFPFSFNALGAYSHIWLSSCHTYAWVAVVVNSGNSPGSCHVSRRTKSITDGDQARHIKCHIQPQGETSGLTRHHTVRGEISGLAPTSHPTLRRGSRVSSWQRIQPWGRSFRTKPYSDHHNTGLLWGFTPSLEPTQHQDISRSEQLPYFNGGGYEWQWVSRHANLNNQAQQSEQL